MDTTDDDNDLPGKNPEPASAESPQAVADAPAAPGTTNANPSLGADIANTNPSPQVPDEYLDILDASDPTPASLVAFAFDSKRHHDEARRTIAFWLLWLLSGLLGATAIGFAALFFTSSKPPGFNELKSLLELILTPLLTLVSAATGFYFGAQKQER